jgi:molecular chaperone DnaJ
MADVTAHRDYYDVLGVARDADEKAIKDAFRSLAMKYHPDRNKAPDAEERFKEIAEAYAILSDPKKRAEYDARGFSGVSGFSPEDLFAGIDFGDLFGDMDFGFDMGGGLFDRLFRSHHRAGPARGQDLEVHLSVPLQRVYHGGKETVRYRRPVACPRCKGSRAEPGSTARSCKKCGGTGRLVTTRQEQKEQGSIRFQRVTICPDCGGSGTFIEKPCSQCHGAGTVDKQESLEINVPAGAEDGMALRVPQHGLPSTEESGAPGDLYVVVRSAPDPRFERLGADLWRAETIEVADAVLGTRLKAPTLDGDVEVKVPPGTQPDSILRLKGEGLPVFGREHRGDINLRIAVHIPEQPSKRERALYEQLRKLAK